MAKKKVSKPIVELDKPNGKPIKFWISAKAASNIYNVNVVNISYNVNGITKQAKGHYFRFATAAEIELYSNIIEQIPDNSEEQKSVEPAPVVESDNTPIGPAPILPEATQPNEIQENTTSAFARLLAESKKKFQNNSK